MLLFCNSFFTFWFKNAFFPLDSLHVWCRLPHLLCHHVSYSIFGLLITHFPIVCTQSSKNLVDTLESLFTIEPQATFVLFDLLDHMIL